MRSLSQEGKLLLCRDKERIIRCGEGGDAMRDGHRERTRGARATIARSVAVYVAIMAGAAAIGALVGALLLGEWFIGAGLAACIAAWLALPTGMLESRGEDA